MPSAYESKDALSETLLTKNSNGMPNLVYFAIVNAIKVESIFFYLYMI